MTASDIRRVEQTIFEPPLGNCLQACVASVLRCDLDEVPNFARLWRAVKGESGSWEVTDPQAWWGALGEAAASRGMAAMELLWPADGKWGMTAAGISSWPAIASVKSPRGDWLHCVVADLLTGEVLWDPYPGALVEGRNVASESLDSWILFVANPSARRQP